LGNTIRKLLTKFLGGPVGYRIKLFCRRLELGLRVIINRKKEPHFNLGRLIRYVVNGSPYVTLKLIDFEKKISVEYVQGGKFVKYDNGTYAYPSDWDETLCIKNLNALLNEQRHPDSPHKYLSPEEIKADWVIYDLGAAEGYQAMQWSKKAKTVIIFEPIKSWFELLKITWM
jgi:hypothetical protein